MINFREASEEVPLPRLVMKTTPYYAALAEKSDAIRKTVAPSEEELVVAPDEAEDPLEEDKHRHGCIVHKYPDRVLFLATNNCASHCRYCTRSRVVADAKQSDPDIWAGVDYVKAHPEVRDVLVSGGDPLTMPLGRLKKLLTELKKIEHVEMLRIGTKVPVVAPHLITDELVAFLKTLHPVYLSLHFTHPDELTEECRAACEKLADAGIPLGSQTVLLKGVNDDSATLKRLFHGLLKIRVRPYYLYHMDRIAGGAHFRTTVQHGIDIMRDLRIHTTGYAVPTYVVDSPRGKLPVDLGYLVEDSRFNVFNEEYDAF